MMVWVLGFRFWVFVHQCLILFCVLSIKDLFREIMGKGKEHSRYNYGKDRTGMELGYSILLKGIKLRQFLADLSNTIFLFFLEYLKCLVKKKSENMEKVFLMKVC